MGQCLSFAAKAAAPIVEDIVEDALKASQAEANKPSASEGAGAAPAPSEAGAAPQAPTSWAAVAGGGSSPPQAAPQAAPASTSVTEGPSGSVGGAVHASLPSDAEQHKVRNVYDGDTLTLTDERRVRLLGIDTPEIKERQPYAEEAKAYTKDRCDKRDIWISFEPSGEKEDHYGRLLCFVWVPAESGKGYLCINEGIVEAGYARAYHPGKGKKLHNWNTMLELQSAARKAQRGVWEDFEDIQVVKTANGSAYHKRSCEHLASVRNLTEMKASEAAERGLHPCRTCFS